MSRARFLVRRVAVAVVSLFLVATAGFLFVTLVPTATERGFGIGAGSPSPGALVEQYVAWLGDLATLQFGQPDADPGMGPGPPGSRLGDAIASTLTYVVPAVALSLVVGLGLGVLAALNHRSWLDRLSSTGAYAALGVPDFWIGQALLYLSAYHLSIYDYTPGTPLDGIPVLTPDNLLTVVFPTLVLTTSLVAAQLRYARAATLEHVGSAFVKGVRAKGAGPRRVARHLVRNASVLLVSLFFAETLAVLVMNVYAVELVFGIEGLGALSYGAIQSRNVPLVLGTLMAFAAVGVVGNLVQDVAYAYLDPRIDAD